VFSCALSCTKSSKSCQPTTHMPCAHTHAHIPVSQLSLLCCLHVQSPLLKKERFLSLAHSLTKPRPLTRPGLSTPASLVYVQPCIHPPSNHASKHIGEERGEEGVWYHRCLTASPAVL
jgi:hypothetical protein